MTLISNVHVFLPIIRFPILAENFLTSLNLKLSLEVYRSLWSYRVILNFHLLIFANCCFPDKISRFLVIGFIMYFSHLQKNNQCHPTQFNYLRLITNLMVIIGYQLVWKMVLKRVKRTINFLLRFTLKLKHSCWYHLILFDTNLNLIWYKFVINLLFLIIWYKLEIWC